MKGVMNNLVWLKVALVGGIALLSGCAVVQRAGMAVLYKEAPVGSSKVIQDLPYAATENPKQRLDLFYPEGTNWPVMVFVYGGGWTSGDKELRVGGKDVYGNIGRFYAARGIGVAVINYRLQPEVGWREQVKDVAAALTWVRTNAATYGGDEKRIYLAGHSAGAHLASMVALNESGKQAGGKSGIKGVIAVSGAALDLADEETYRLGESRAYYEKRFLNGSSSPDWKEIASPTHYITSNAPPFLILYAQGEKKGLQRQSQRLAEELSRAGTVARVVPVRGESHQRMVLVLSREDKEAAPSILEFIRGQSSVQ